MVFGPVVAVVAHWFKKRKGLALGVMAFGSSTGATVYPVIVRKLIDAVGCVLSSFRVFFRSMWISCCAV